VHLLEVRVVPLIAGRVENAFSGLRLAEEQIAPNERRRAGEAEQDREKVIERRVIGGGS